MDRNKALEQLESVRNESDLTDPQFAEALAALEDDAAARQEFDRRLQLDGRIASAMLDVEVPDGLREKLVAVCDGGTVATPEKVAPQSKSSRRKWLGVLASLAAIVVLAVLVFPKKPTVSFDQLVEFGPRENEDIRRLQLDAESNPMPFQIAKAPVWFDRHRDANLSVAWPSESMPFEGQTDATSEVIVGAGWVLIATPKQTVSNVPNLTALGSRVSAGYAYKAWQDERFVYVLFAKGDKGAVDRAFNVVYPGATA